MIFLLEERRLLTEEDHLIKKVQNIGVNDEVKGTANGLARDWKLYSRKGRDTEQNSPKTKLAIKHCLALLEFARAEKPNWTTLQETLEYGRAEILNPAPSTYNVPIIKIGNPREMIGLRFSEESVPFMVSKVIPFRVMSDGDLEKISSCASCPAGGTCTLKESCRSYSGTEYASAKFAKMGPALKSPVPDPTSDEYRHFALYDPK